MIQFATSARTSVGIIFSLITWLLYVPGNFSDASGSHGCGGVSLTTGQSLQAAL